MQQNQIATDLFAAADERRYPDSPGFSNQTTSKEAAKAIAPAMGRLQHRIWDHIRAKGGLTARQVEEDLGMRTPTVTARISELVLAKRLEDSGDKRETSPGRRGIVWRAVDGE